jgi:predicted RNA-binding protein with PUA-like domain
MNTRKWLMKTEPTTYSIDHLKSDGITHWEGVRNYQARNFMMNEMSVGDDVFIYHSNTKIPGIVGLATISSKAYPDHFAFDKSSKYFDPKSSPQLPRWYMVDVAFKKKFPIPIALSDLKDDSKLRNMMVVKKGSRLSIQPVEDQDFNYIIGKYNIL